MDTDERLMSLMAVAEDHQGTVTRLLEATREREVGQSATFTDLMQRMEDKHDCLTARYEALLHQQSTRLADRLDWKTLVLSVGVTFICCLMIVVGANLYFWSLTEKLQVVETRYERLKDYKVKFSSCPYEDKEYPCLAVKAEWGSYGGGKIFIIDAD